jgi:hypothetical protein
MKIELKKIKHSAALSQETNAYSAEIWVDSVKRGTVQNQGFGGPDDVQPTTLAMEIIEYAKTLPHINCFGKDLPQSLETVLGGTLDRHLGEKRLKRLLSTKTVFIEDGKCYSSKSRPGNLKEGSIVLNDLSLTDALELFLKIEA